MAYGIRQAFNGEEKSVKVLPNTWIRILDLLPFLLKSKKLYPDWASWLFTSDITPRAGFACRNRILMAGIFNMARHPSRISFMVTTQEEALQQLVREKPGILIATVDLEDGSGLELIGRARSVVNSIRTVLIVDGKYDNLVTAGLSAADAVFDQVDCGGNALPWATLARRLALNQLYRSPSVVAAMNAQQQQNTLWRDAPPDLTPRELEMVELMVEGLSDRQIAEKMLVSYETARSHGKNLRLKLGCKTRSEAVAKLLRLGLARLRGR
jgi:DNA-binding NarL/FixJ family response regulator